MVQDKSSLAPEGEAIAFELDKENGFSWLGHYDISVDDLLSGIPKEKKSEQAENLILEYISKGKYPQLSFLRSMCRSNLPTVALVRVSMRATLKFCFAIFSLLSAGVFSGSRSYTTFSKCVTHYDTFSTSAAKMSWALRGGYGALPRCLRTTPQQGQVSPAGSVGASEPNGSEVSTGHPHPLKRTPCTPSKLYAVTSRKRNIARLQVCLSLQCCNLKKLHSIFSGSCQYY